MNGRIYSHTDQFSSEPNQGQGVPNPQPVHHEATPMETVPVPAVVSSSTQQIIGCLERTAKRPRHHEPAGNLSATAIFVISANWSDDVFLDIPSHPQCTGFDVNQAAAPRVQRREMAFDSPNRSPGLELVDKSPDTADTSSRKRGFGI